MNDLMTTAEVAETLRTSPETLKYWRYLGTGPASARIGRRVMYRRADVEKWLDEQFSASAGRTA